MENIKSAYFYKDLFQSSGDAMNILWSSMLLLGIAYGAIRGRMPEMTEGVIRASREAVVLAVSLVGVTGI